MRYRVQGEGTSSMKFTRRELGGLAAMGLASRLAPSALAQDSDRKIGFCAVGLGRISEIYTRATKLSKQARIVAVVSGHREKAEKFAADYDVPAKNIYSYDNFDSIADNKEIDAVYIGLPNGMHAEYAIRAARAGKHALCEKPMANTPGDCQAMIDAFKKAGKKLMIAYRIRYEPFNLKAAETIASGKLGKIQTIDAWSGFNMNPRDVVVKGVATKEWRLDGKLAGGGPMMDMGIYALNGVRLLAGEEPTDVKGTWSVIDQDGRFKDVEENLTWTMKFPSGVLATCTTSYGANIGTMIHVVGTRGTIHIEPASGYSGIKVVTKIQGQPDLNEASTEQHPAQFVREADHFSECILENKDPKTPGEEGLRDMKLITEIYKSCGRKA